ncbi:MAG: ComF family protein, partial [Elusimicrobia bacterium]|nr:ComF family protein [Elusimicrobiota bacterium]
CRLIRAAAAHRGPAASLVHAFKFRGSPSAARAAGGLLAKAVALYSELSGFDALVPVPLHPRRERERGYNQAELLARELGAASGLPLQGLLERRLGSRPTWSLRRTERRTELSGAFSVRAGGPSAEGKRLILIDDVCASATTLEECALALRRAGAADVAAAVFTRAGRFT